MTNAPHEKLYTNNSTTLEFNVIVLALPLLAQSLIFLEGKIFKYLFSQEKENNIVEGKKSLIYNLKIVSPFFFSILILVQYWIIVVVVIIIMMMMMMMMIVMMVMVMMIMEMIIMIMIMIFFFTCTGI